MDVRDNGANPLITLQPWEVLAWLRQKADEAVYADRETCAVQLNVSYPFGNGLKLHHECPALTIMVSNIRDSRRGSTQPDTTRDAD
jgi:hypothetical protein